MSTSQALLASRQHITPPSSFADRPLTPPPTDEKPFAQAPRVIALFRDRQAGRCTTHGPWTEFQLAAEEYDELQRQLDLDTTLSGYVNDKIRYDYDGETHRLVVRMPTEIHELFIDGVEDSIRSQLKAIRSGSDRAALFAQKVRPARSTRIHFPVEHATPNKKSRYEPDASFRHLNARYPGVIIEVAYSQKRKSVEYLAQNYLIDSDGSVRVVVGLDIEYGKKKSRKATLSVWRTCIVHTARGDELQVVREVADEAFRDDDGNPADYPGLRLHLSDFAYEELVQKEMGEHDPELIISSEQLCQFLDEAESQVEETESLGQHLVGPGIKKRKRSPTPPEEITSNDEARYVEEEERAAKRMADDDSDYEDMSIRRSSSE